MLFLKGQAALGLGVALLLAGCVPFGTCHGPRTWLACEITWAASLAGWTPVYYINSCNRTPLFMGRGPGRLVNTRGPRHGLGGAAHVDARPGPAYQFFI